MKRTTPLLVNAVKILVSLAVIGGSIWFIQAQVQPDWPAIGGWLKSNAVAVFVAIVLVRAFLNGPVVGVDGCWPGSTGRWRDLQGPGRRRRWW